MKINVTRSSLPDFEEYTDEIRDLWDSHWITNNGYKHNALQSQLSKFLKSRNLVLFTNGHLALETIITAFKFPKGSEVITTPFTFVSTTNAIVRNGLNPVFCDINSHDYTMDVNKIEELITEKTVAIMPVHVYGNICDVDKIEKIAKRHNLKVIYDAAHAFGVKYKGKSIACFGDAAMFSFHATKVFNTIEGGCVCFNDSKFVQILNEMKNFGLHGEEECIYFGGNAKMNEFQAAMGICNLRHVSKNIQKRKMIVDRYKLKLSGIAGITICKEQNNVETNYSYMPVLFDKKRFDRDAIKVKLEKIGIGTRKYFYPIISEFECFREYNKNNTPIAKQISENILCLPLYPDLPLDIVDLISEEIIKCCNDN